MGNFKRLDKEALRADKLLEQQKQIVCNQNEIVGENKVTTTPVLLAADFTNQNPSPDATDTVKPITFGGAQSTATWDLDIDGKLTCNVAGTYLHTVTVQYGRSGGAGTSVIFFRKTTNGTQDGVSIVVELENANADLPLFVLDPTTYSVGDVVQYEFFRDDSGNNSGGLITTEPTNLDWDDAPSAFIGVFTQEVSVNA